MPALSTNDILYQATQDILQVLQNTDTDCPLTPCTPQELTAIKDLVSILHKKLSNPDPLPPPPPQEKVVGALQRVPTHNKTSLTLKADSENNKAAFSNTLDQMHTGPASTLKVTWQNPVSQTDPVTPQPTSLPPEPNFTNNNKTAADYWKCHGTLGHRPAPKRSGSTNQVLVNWEDHEPTYVNVNTFSDQGLNNENCVTLYQHAQTNNLLNTKGWKQFKKNTEPTPTNHTNFCMTKCSVIFFEQALHAHQINKVSILKLANCVSTQPCCRVLMDTTQLARKHL